MKSQQCTLATENELGSKVLWSVQSRVCFYLFNIQYVLFHMMYLRTVLLPVLVVNTAQQLKSMLKISLLMQCNIDHNKSQV